MYVKEQDYSYLTVTWQAGKNNTGTVQLPCHSVHYMFQTANEPKTGEICVATWYFQMLKLTSEMIAPHLGPIVQGGQVEDVQINLQETTLPEIVVQEEPINQALTDKTEVGPRRSSTAKTLKCDIEGIICDVLPTFA